MGVTNGANHKNSKIFVAAIFICLIVAGLSLYYASVADTETENAADTGSEIAAQGLDSEQSKQPSITWVGAIVYEKDITVVNSTAIRLDIREATRNVLEFRFDDPVWYALYDTPRYDGYKGGKRGMAKITSGRSTITETSQKFDVNNNDGTVWWLVIEGNAKGDVKVFHVANLGI